MEVKAFIEEVNNHCRGYKGDTRDQKCKTEAVMEDIINKNNLPVTIKHEHDHRYKIITLVIKGYIHLICTIKSTKDTAFKEITIDLNRYITFEEAIEVADKYRSDELEKARGYLNMLGCSTYIEFEKMSYKLQTAISSLKNLPKDVISEL